MVIVDLVWVELMAISTIAISALVGSTAYIPSVCYVCYGEHG